MNYRYASIRMGNFCRYQVRFDVEVIRELGDLENSALER